MIKKILKILFPIVWLKKFYLFYNRIKIKTLDRIFFPEFIIKDAEFLIKRDIKVYDRLEINENVLDDDIRRGLQLWHGWTQDEYLLHFRHKTLIEPDYGWAVSGKKLVYSSLGFSRAEYLPKPDFYKLYYSNNKEIITVDNIISLRDTGEENYFHFYNDVLAKLCFLESQNVLNKQTSFLISRKLFEKPYFQYFLKKSSLLKGKKLLIQDQEYICANEVLFCKPLTHTKRYLDQIRDSIEEPKIEIPSVQRKIFLTRNPKRLRYIENMEEVTEICDQFGYEVVDTDEMELEDQITLFSSVSHLAGIHGAGLTNMIYGEKNILGITEIFPPQNYIPFQYIMMAKIYGYRYNAILGKKGRDYSRGGFVLDVRLLKEKLASQVKNYI